MSHARHLLVVGASGVIGSAAVTAFGQTPGWRVSALSRRQPIAPNSCSFTHISVDLGNAAACRAALADLPSVTHLIYAAAKEAPDLVAGWSDDALIAENGRMFAHVLDPVADAGHLRHAIVLQGTKAYGAHRHAIRIPAREDGPRDDHPNFYWLHEDHARSRAGRDGFTLTIFRPQILLGTAPGVAMNPTLPFGAYAALCAERGLPFALPGEPDALWEVVDASLLADAFAWAFDTPAAADQTFNITNGDVFAPGHAWAEIASALGLTDGGIADFNFADFFADPANEAAWADLAARHGLRIANLSAFLGKSHQYADLLLSPRIAAKATPVLLSTIKLRQAGFAGCRDALDSLLGAIDAMVGLRLLPPFPGRA